MKNDNAEKLIEKKLKDKMLDPSLLFRKSFWENDMSGNLYIPLSFFKIKKEDISFISKYYQGRVLEQNRLEYSTVKDYLNKYEIKTFDRAFYVKDWYENNNNKTVNQKHIENIEKIEKSNLKEPLKEILIDEYVFLASKSCLLSAVKKVFKNFEYVDVFPIFNLEEVAPDEWRKPISGLKKFCKWIGFFAGFYISGGNITITLASQFVNYIRIVIVDP